MSDYERGPYTPPSDRLAFDRRQPERGGGPAPVTLIVSALVLAAIVGGVFLVYRGGIRHKGAPTSVGVPVADMKTAAPDAANAAPAALVIDKSDAAANAAPAFAPPPEEPLPRPVAIASAPAAAPPPVVAAKAAPVAASAAAPAAAKPAAKPPAPLTIASIANAALANGPPMKPAPRAVAAAPAAAGWAQIGAFSSAALADKGWHDTVKFAPDAMAGKGQQVQPVSVSGKTFYRAYVTGFPSRAAAEAFCGKLKAAAKPCIVK